MTRDELVNTVFTRLKEQGAYGHDGFRCRYRTVEGLKCAIGVLIPDDKYDDTYERCEPDYVLARVNPDLCEHVELLEQMQALHDSFACNGRPFGTFLDSFIDMFDKPEEIACTLP